MNPINNILNFHSLIAKPVTQIINFNFNKPLLKIPINTTMKYKILKKENHQLV
jgi:hypothetical protein